MQEPNYLCPTCDKKFYYTTVTISYGSLGIIHKSQGKQLICDCDSKTVLDSIPKKIESGSFSNTGTGKVTPASKLTMSQIESDRTQRSRDHFKKDVFPTLDRDSKKHHLKKNPSLRKFQ